MTQAFNALNASPGARDYGDQLTDRGTDHNARPAPTPTGSWASCTAASQPAPTTTKRTHGRIASSRLPLDT
jgi:hypothetical protein